MNGVLRRARSLFPFQSDPSADSRIFRGIRIRLILWYSGVLAVALLIFGIALYTTMRETLLSPVDKSLQGTSAQLAQSWQQNLQTFPLLSCPPLSRDAQHGALVACYTPQGGVAYGTDLARFVPHFLDTSFAQSAARSGSATETIDGGSSLGKLRLYAVSVTDTQGDPIGVLEVGQSISDQSHALDTLLHLLWLLAILTLVGTAAGGIFLAGRALAPARMAYARQREFIADASHELRTPLTMMRADAEVLLRGRDRMEPDDVEILEDVVAEASHMAALANSMLNLARLDAGDIPIESDVADLALIAADIGRRAGPLAAERGVTIRVEANEPVLVVADRLLVEQAALVLVDNAIKYNRPGGEVVISAALRENQAVFAVRDTGIGIDAEHLPHLGERFYRVDKARSREGGGAGLGVSIARSIAARHGGSLRLESVPGEGTTAILTLPAARRTTLAAHSAE